MAKKKKHCRKLIQICGLAAILIGSVGENNLVSAQDTVIDVTINGAFITFSDAQPLMDHNRTLLPVRIISESIGISVAFLAFMILLYSLIGFIGTPLLMKFDE